MKKFLLMTCALVLTALGASAITFDKAMVRRSAATAQRVVKTSGNTNITIGEFMPATYTGEYFVTMNDANSTLQFIIDIDTSVNDFELGKTYTQDDMILDYTGIFDSEDWYAYTPITAATYTETKDASGKTHVEASMTDESGNTYNLTYTQADAALPIDVVVSDMEYQDYSTDMFFAVYDEEGNVFLFDIDYTGSFDFNKTYTFSDMEYYYSYYQTASGSYKDYSEATFTISKDTKGLIHIEATVVTTDGKTYNIKYDETEFAPTGIKYDVNGTELKGEYLSSYGMFVYTANWGEYKVQLAFNTTEEKTTYTNDDLIADYCVIYSSSQDIYCKMLASDITITTVGDTKTLTGSIYAKNGDEYVLNLVYVKPEPKDITISVPNASLTNKTAGGFWQIGGQNAEKTYSINLYFMAKSLQGVFNEEEMDGYYTYVADKTSGSTKYFENPSAANITSAIVADSLVVDGTMELVASDGQIANVTLHLSTPYCNSLITAGKYEITATITPADGVTVPTELQKYLEGYTAQCTLTGDSLELVISTDEEGFVLNGFSVKGDALVLNNAVSLVYGDKTFQLADAYGKTNSSLMAKAASEAGTYTLSNGTIVYKGMAVGTISGITFKKVEDLPTGITEKAIKSSKTVKVIDNGNIVIIKNGVKYGIAGF